MWEALDPCATRKSIAAGGQAVGYGPGVTTTVTEYNSSQRSQTLTATGAKLLTASGASSVGTVPNTKQRPSRDEKKGMQQAKVEARDAKKEGQVAAAEAVEEKVRSLDQGLLTKCGRCGKRFTCSGWYQNHRDKWCESQVVKTWAEQRRRRVPLLLDSIDELRAAEHRARHQSLQLVEVVLRARGADPEPIGIGMELTDRGMVVKSVADGSVAQRTALVEEGFVVASIDSVLPARANALSGNVTATKMRIIFRRPQSRIPHHGSARLTYHKSTRYKVLPYQLEWLEKNVYHDGRRLSGSVRDKGAHRMMKAAFHNQLRTDTMEVAWLPQLEIAKWLVKQVKATKEARTVARKEAVGGGSEVTEDQPTMPKRARCGGQRAKEVGDAKGRKGKGPATIGKRKGGGGGGRATTKSKRSEAADDDGGGSGYSDEELPDFGSEEEDDMEEDE